MEHEVAGEGDHQQHLGDLAGLEAEAGDVDPDAGAVDVAADDGEERQDQQHDAGQAGGVGQPLQHAVVAQQEQRGDEEHDAERHPGQLLARERVLVLAQRLVGEVEAVDHREAEPVERGDERQQHRVGVRRDDADGHVGGDDQAGQPAAVADEVGRDRALDAEADGGVRPDADREREDEQEQLRTPATPVHEAHEGSGLTHRSPPVNRPRRPGSPRSCPRSSGRRRGRRPRCPRAPSRRRCR